MSRFNKVIMGLICLSIIILSQMPMAFGGPSGNNRIIYSDHSTSENESHVTYVPATPKPYKIRVYYNVIGDSTANYWWKYSPRCHIRIKSQWIVYDDDVYGRTLSGHFDVPAGQQAYVEIIAGTAGAFWNKWDIYISETLTYYLDNEYPAAPVLSANATLINNVLYTTGTIDLSWTAVDDYPLSFDSGGYFGPSGIRGYKVFDGNNEISVGYIADTNKQLTLNEGVHLLTVKAYDKETYINTKGNESMPSNPVKVIVDQTPPTANLRINNSSQFTNIQDVTLSLSNFDDGTNGSGISQVCFSNDNISYTEWEPCTESIISRNWQLGSGDGQKTVYVKLRDVLGNETPNENPIQAAITLDTTPPSGSLSINENASLTSSQLVTLTLTVEGDPAWMQFSNDGTNFSALEEYSASKYWTLSNGEGTKTVYVKLTDAFGNTTTESITDTIYFDQNPSYPGFTPTHTLQSDEDWTSNYIIYGQVIVPAYRTLTIRQNLIITVDGPTNSDPNQNGLIIEAGGTLIIESGVSFSTPLPGWMGIMISGSATISGATISLAQRGLAILTDASVTVSSSTFSNNFVGIHVYDSQPMISGCIFQNNIYGIKEDENGQPVVSDCSFSNNAIDYYDETLTKTTVQ
jgi:parallel beta-helix repeat protein